MVTPVPHPLRATEYTLYVPGQYTLLVAHFVPQPSSHELVEFGILDLESWQLVARMPDRDGEKGMILALWSMRAVE